MAHGDLGYEKCRLARKSRGTVFWFFNAIREIGVTFQGGHDAIHPDESVGEML